MAGPEPHQRPYRWVMLFLLWLVYFSHGSTSRSAAPPGHPHADRPADDIQPMGLVLGSWQLSHIAVAIFAGILLDRWGIRRALFLGILVIGLSVLLLKITPEPC